jgi:hypothetical protein
MPIRVMAPIARRIGPSAGSSGPCVGRDRPRSLAEAGILGGADPGAERKVTYAVSSRRHGGQVCDLDTQRV